MFELDFSRDAITAFMRELPVRKIPGFGRVTERCLEGLGVEVGSDGSLAFTEAHPVQVCGDIYTRRAELLLMDHWFTFRGLW